MILDSSGNPLSGKIEDIDAQKKCNHGVIFDKEEAEKILGSWSPKSDVEFICGNPMAAEIKRRWPRLDGVCPNGCGYIGIAYASVEHYSAGDW